MIRLISPVLGLVAILAAGPGVSRDLAVSDAAGLNRALRVAEAGDHLILAPGEYGVLDLWPQGPADPRFGGPVTLRGADPAQPPVLTGLRLTAARNLAFEEILFAFRAAPGQLEVRPFQVNHSSDIVFVRVEFRGSDARGIGPVDDGFPAGYGLSVRKSDRVTVEESRIHGFLRGLVMGAGDGHVVRRNEVSDIRSDGMNFVKVTNLLVEGNRIGNFRRSFGSKDHADMIQFWTRGATTPTTGVTIRDNVLDMGRGDQTQSIFLRNEAVDDEGRGRAMYYRDIRIEGNLILNAHANGIVVGETDGLVIRGNRLIGARATGPKAGGAVIFPRIRVAPASSGVVIEDNLAAGFPAARPGWRMARNQHTGRGDGQ